MASIYASTPLWSVHDIRASVKVGCDFFWRDHSLAVTQQERALLEADLLARYEDVRKDDISTRSLHDELLRKLQALLDAKQMQDIGAVPLVEGKLYPIEDEV